MTEKIGRRLDTRSSFASTARGRETLGFEEILLHVHTWGGDVLQRGPVEGERKGGQEWCVKGGRWIEG